MSKKKKYISEGHREFYQCRKFYYVHLDSGIVLLANSSWFYFCVVVYTALSFSLQKRTLNAQREPNFEHKIDQHTHTHSLWPHITKISRQICLFFSVRHRRRSRTSFHSSVDTVFCFVCNKKKNLESHVKN